MDKLDCVTELWAELVKQKKKLKNWSNNNYGSWGTSLETAERQYYALEFPNNY